MKNIKKTLTFFLTGLFAVSLLVACQKESMTDLERTDLVEMTNDLSSTTDAPEFRAPNPGGNTVCYSAHLRVDKDCDGVYELGWNQATASANGCQVLLNQMVATAVAEGWCYVLPIPNCGIYIGTCK